MCADLLALLDFDDVDPQAPLGGGDGKKDILCSKQGIKYVAAAYFPTTVKSYADVESKFLGDLKGVESNNRDGFLFFTNQHLTIGQRKKLADAAKSSVRDCQIIHLERLRTLLDQPAGYGIRVQYLRIALSPEEQFAYFANARERNDRVLTLHSRMLGAIQSKLDHLVNSQEFVAQTMGLLASDKEIEIPPPPTRPDLFLGGFYTSPEDCDPFSTALSISTVLALHRGICFDMPQDSVGRLRKERVYIAAAGKPISQAIATPPSPEEVPKLLEELLEEWKRDFGKLKSEQPAKKVEAIASFHANFLRIHPFLDGNGRVARFLLMQLCLDLFGVADMGVFDKGAEYFAALKNADNNDLTFLEELIKPVAGVED